MWFKAIVLKDKHSNEKEKETKKINSKEE